MSERVSTEDDVRSILRTTVDLDLAAFDSETMVARLAALIERERAAAQTVLRSEQHPDCVTVLRSAWEALGAAFEEARAERDRLRADLAQVCRELENAPGGLRKAIKAAVLSSAYEALGQKEATK